MIKIPTDRFGRPMDFCVNPLCDRWVPQGIMYCCGGCDKAHHGGYEIHETGPLGHSESCNANYNERGSTRPQ